MCSGCHGRDFRPGGEELGGDQARREEGAIRGGLRPRWTSEESSGAHPRPPHPGKSVSRGVRLVADRGGPHEGGGGTRRTQGGERGGRPGGGGGELGDLLFAVANLARFVSLCPEDALRKTIDKFQRRFQYIERELPKRGKKLGEASLEDMDELWEEVKKTEKGR